MCNQFRYVIEAVVWGLEPDATTSSLDEVMFDVGALVCWQANADGHGVGLTWLTDHEVLEGKLMDL